MAGFRNTSVIVLINDPRKLSRACNGRKQFSVQCNGPVILYWFSTKPMYNAFKLILDVLNIDKITSFKSTLRSAINEQWVLILVNKLHNHNV